MNQAVRLSTLVIGKLTGTLLAALALSGCVTSTVQQVRETANRHVRRRRCRGFGAP